VLTKTKFHITIGHQTAIGLIHLFSLPITSEAERKEVDEKYIFNQSNLKNLRSNIEFDFSQKYGFETELIGEPLPAAKKEEEKKQADDSDDKLYFAIIQLEKPILIQESSLLIGSKLDMDISAKQCRLSFYGQVIRLIKEPEEDLPKINVTKEKLKVGRIERVTDPSTILVKDLFAKETSPDIYIGLQVTLNGVKDEAG